MCVGVSELVRVVTQCGHLVGDTIVQGSATSHMVPVEQADGRFACVCDREADRDEYVVVSASAADVNLRTSQSSQTWTSSDVSVTSLCLFSRVYSKVGQCKLVINCWDIH